MLILGNRKYFSLQQRNDIMTVENEMRDTMKTLQELTLIDNFLFGAVMKNPELCRPLLETLLDIKIQKIEYPVLEKPIDLRYQSKGIRLDVYVEDDLGTIYNIEMQATDKKNLPKRMRYYQGMIDLNIIDKGEDYNNLRKSYIIFICNYDEFKLGRHIYTFENRCVQNLELLLGDDTTKIVLNTEGTANDISPALKDILNVIDGKQPQTELGKHIAAEADKVKNSEEWESVYMTLMMRDKENQELGSAKTLVQIIDALAADNGNIEEACAKAKISPERYYKAKQIIEDSEYND